MVKTFYFLRHGQIELGNWWKWRFYNAFSANRDDPSLSQLGMTKSEFLGKILKNEINELDAIIVSPFTRCIQTAQQLKKNLSISTPEITINPLLGEYEFMWKHYCAKYPEGLPNVYKHITASGTKELHCNYPETYEDMQKRCTFFAEEIMTQYNKAIFITHGSIVKYFASYFSGLGENENVDIHFSDYIKVTINEETNEKKVEVINW